MTTGILCGLLFATCLCCCGALQCLQCDHVPDPRDCNQLVTCASNQQCISQKYIGTNMATYYSLGCANAMVCQQIFVGKRHTGLLNGSDILLNNTKVLDDLTINEENESQISRKIRNDYKHRLSQTVQLNTGKRSVGDIAVCSQCCNSNDGCNGRLCGAATATNLRCLSCADVPEIRDCDHVQECSSNKTCNAFKNVYRQSCVVCCNQTDFCNYRACDNWQPQILTNTSSGHGLSTMINVQSHHPTTFTTSQPTTTTQAPRVVINGPARGDFNANVTLQCVTVPPAQSYDWKMNASSPLPTGVTTSTHSTVAGTVAGINVLTISNLNESTIGEYTCIATTNGHVIQSTLFIDITPAAPTVSIQKAISSNVLSLKCIVGGYPRPSIVWEFKPNAIGAHGVPPGVAYNETDRESVVVVGSYRPTDHNGDWSCIATNSIGTAKGTASVP